MDLGIRGKRALVAGASTGIGFACAKALAAEGVEVFLVARNEARLQQAVEEIIGAGGKASGVAADLSTALGVENAFDRAIGSMRGIDILICNTGGPRAGTFEKLADSDWEHAVSLLLMSAVRLVRRAIPGMTQRKWGRIVMIESTSVRQPIEGLLLSNSVRMAVVGLAKTLVSELSGTNVTVNVVAPGYTATERLGELASARAEADRVAVEEIYERWAADTPLKRLALPEEIASAVAFLSSERGAYVNGVTFPVDGGRLRGY